MILNLLPYIPEMRRKEKTYRPEDMWDIDDSELFSKYCPGPANVVSTVL